MSEEILRILISIPSNRYQFEFELLQSLIEHIQRENENFQGIKVKIETKIIDHSDIASHTEHVHAVKSMKPYFSVIVVCHFVYLFYGLIDVVWWMYE